MKTSDFQFSTPTLSKLQFEINKNFVLNKAGIEFGIQTNIDIHKSDKANQAIVSFTIIIGEVSDNVPFYIIATEEASFKWSEDENDIDILLNQNAPALLLAYLRPIIAAVTSSSKYPSYNIPFINFTN